MSAKIIITLTITCLVLVFILQNTAVVRIQFLFWSLSMSRSLLVVALVGLGMLLGWLLSSFISFKGKRR